MIHILNLNILESQRIIDADKLYTIKGINVALLLEKLDINANFVAILCDEDYEKYSSKLSMINYTLVTDSDDNIFGKIKKHQKKECAITHNIERKLKNYIDQNVTNRDTVIVTGEVMNHEYNFLDQLILSINQKTPNIILDIDSIDQKYIGLVKPSLLRLSKSMAQSFFKDDDEIFKYMDENNIKEIYIYDEDLNLSYYKDHTKFYAQFNYDIDTTNLVSRESLLAGIIYSKRYNINDSESLKYALGVARLTDEDETLNEENLKNAINDIDVIKK